MTIILMIKKAWHKSGLYRLYETFVFQLFLIAIAIAVALAGFATPAYAGNRFTSNYPCSDSVKTCISSGTRIIDGFAVHKDCWEWSYKKTCNYPSKDDCKNYNHCYLVADLPCLLRDSLGNCVNLQREFSCKSWQPVTIDKELVRTGLVEKEGKEKLVCKGLHCIDGNCFDKSYLTDDDMLDSVSKLYAISQMKDAKDLNFSLFSGFAQSCSKKAANYTNCCSSSLKFWGKNLGAGCTKDEVDLIEKRQKNLCEYACKENKQTMGVTTVVKHHYCCFGNLFNKVIQVEGRKQLFPFKARDQLFNNNGQPDCRGLTLSELMSLDFNKMDFSEFYAEIVKRMKLPNVGDVQARVNSSLPDIRKYDNDPNNKQNNMAGWSGKIGDDSWETQEERRLEAERASEERQRKEAAKLAEKLALEKQEQLAKEQYAKEQLAREQEAKKNRKLLKEQRLVIAKEEYKQAINASHQQRALMDGSFINGVYKITRYDPDIWHLPQYPEYQRRVRVWQELQSEIEKIEKELKSGNY